MQGYLPCRLRVYVKNLDRVASQLIMVEKRGATCVFT